MYLKLVTIKNCLVAIGDRYPGGHRGPKIDRGWSRMRWWKCFIHKTIFSFVSVRAQHVCWSKRPSCESRVNKLAGPWLYSLLPVLLGVLAFACNPNMQGTCSRFPVWSSYRGSLISWRWSQEIVHASLFFLLSHVRFLLWWLNWR